MLKSLLVIAIGASLGGWLRWLLGMKLNALFPTTPPRYCGGEHGRG